MPWPLTAIILVFACLHLTVFLVRAVSVLHYGSLFGTTGGESVMVYSVWKRMHGYAIYEWPLARPFSLSLYNYLFYFLYAEILKLLGWWDAQILTFGRMLTAAFAALGALAQWQLVKAKLREGLPKYLCLVLCLALWFSTSFVRWWAISIRPDIPAVALVMVALLCLARLDGEKGALLAAICFYLAWSFKQSIVLVAAASVLYLFFTRRRSAFVLLGVLTGGIAATYLLGSAAYRYSIFVAPRVVPSFSISYALSSLKQPLVVNSYLLVPLLLLFARPWQRNFNIKDLLKVAGAIGLLGGAVAMSKDGAGDNYLLEALIAIATLLLVELFEDPNRRVALLFLALGCVQPALQIGSHLIHQPRFGTLEIADATEYKQAQALAQRLASLPKPLLTTDETFCLPWHSTNNSYPAYVLDMVFHAGAWNLRGPGGPIDLIRDREVPVLMLRTSDLDFRRALAGKYRKVGEETHQHLHYDVFVAGNLGR